MSDDGTRRYRFSVHGSPGFWYRLRRNQCSENIRFGRPFKIQSGQPIELDPIVKPDNLLAVYYGRRGQSGQAPGIDGIGHDDLGRSEIAAAARAISQAIKQRRYRPLPAREKEIAKSQGGTRMLKIPPIMERTVAAAVNTALTPVIDNQLLPRVMGCRPGRNIEMLFAELEAAVVTGDRWIIAAADIRKAFDDVPIDGAVNAIRDHLTNRDCPVENGDNSTNTDNAGINDVIWLIETILTGHDPGSTKGIAQGCPLSPLALNTLLNQVLDRPLVAACPGTPFWRYVDDLSWACQNVSEGQRAIQETRHLLNGAGFTIKGEPNPVNLRRQGAYVDLLGYRIRRRNDRQLNYELTREKWHDLHKGLRTAHQAPNPSKTAEDVVGGWVMAHGPAFESAQERSVILEGISRATARYGFRESGSRDLWDERMQEARKRWDGIRRAAFCTTQHTDTVCVSS